MIEKKWWMTTNIYQIYLRSFYDANNDGIGDLLGVKEKLNYLKDLGIGTIWISPHYDSPMDDNGYDVRDFYKVSSDYGDISAFKDLVRSAKEKNMNIVVDLVLNHTSDEHEWFKIAKDPKHPLHNKYHDYYIWQKPKYNNHKERIRPTRWVSWFGGPTWDYNEATDEYYLHIFSKKMPDLNWRNKELREDMKKVIKFWIDLGVDGFRVDASNHLEKNWDFPDGVPGYENFSSIPKHHEYIKELALELFEPYNLLTLGESGGATKDEVLKYVGFDSHEFNLLIHFGHCWADTGYTNDKITGKWSKTDLRVVDIKKSYDHQYKMIEDKGFNLIYWHNHDQPRVVSHYGNTKKYHVESARMLAITLYFMPGTPIVYQGEEIGMTNVMYNDISDFRDVEVFTEYKNMISNGASEKEALQAIKDRSRDNARTPMQWNDRINGGFSKVKPWINTNYNYDLINVEAQDKHKDSILNTYRFILNHRLVDNENIVFGDIKFININDNESFCYINQGKSKDYLVIANFRDYEIKINLDLDDFQDFEYFYGDKISLKSEMILNPYQSSVFIRTKA
ncbi:MAG: alpha-glucosidase [Candidatus Izemoplasmatales bacterium]|nr:alpha-glucosidase [Candidatus Izemoplasmatales bacterium]